MPPARRPRRLRQQSVGLTIARCRLSADSWPALQQSPNQVVRPSRRSSQAGALLAFGRPRQVHAENARVPLAGHCQFSFPQPPSSLSPERTGVTTGPVTRPTLRARVVPFLYPALQAVPDPDRKSTRLNSSHLVISYAVFCLEKK